MGSQGLLPGKWTTAIHSILLSLLRKRGVGRSHHVIEESQQSTGHQQPQRAHYSRWYGCSRDGLLSCMEPAARHPIMRAHASTGKREKQPVVAPYTVLSVSFRRPLNSCKPQISRVHTHKYTYMHTYIHTDAYPEAHIHTKTCVQTHTQRFEN